MNKKPRLELNWIGKEDRPRVEPRILLEDPEKSYHAKVRREGDIFDNKLIFGDNLLALKALEQEFCGRIKCVYIDPPFNTQQDFANCVDGMEHSQWLSMMQARLMLIHRLLSPDGTLFIHIDDNEVAYLTVLCDEIFGRSNRCYVITFKQASATGHKAINPGCVSTTNFVLIYAKDKSQWIPNRVFTARERDKRYGQFISNFEDPYDSWKLVPLAAGFAIDQALTEREARKAIKEDPALLDEFVMSKSERVVQLARPDYDSVGKETRSLIDESISDPKKVYRQSRSEHSDIYLIGGQRILFYSDKLRMVDGKYITAEPLTTLWDDVLSNNIHKEGGVDFPKGKKPEALIKRCLELATQSGDIVLDSFAGSGTTAAVAHKMKRRWIAVEFGDHCDTHIAPRLRSVIDGSDVGGITEAVRWKGGGGFRYLQLAPSLLEKDRWDNWVISRDYNAAMLAEAVCKLMGFTYAPSEAHYWMHGHSSEKDFIYVTTQSLTIDQLRAISEEVGEGRSLLVCCKAFHAKAAAFPNLTIRKIPHAVLRKCEWGKDDYSLDIANLPRAPETEEETSEADAKKAAPAKAADRRQADFFGGGDGKK